METYLAYLWSVILEVNNTTDHDVMFEFSGHVNWASVRVHTNGYGCGGTIDFGLIRTTEEAFNEDDTVATIAKLESLLDGGEIG